MTTKRSAALAKREREILDVLYRRGRATANEVLEDLGAERSYSTIRTQLRVLEQKGHVRHEVDGTRFVYLPTVPRHAARKSALRHLMHTFFDGSPERVVAALLGDASTMSEEQLDRIASLVEQAREEGR
jgi:predicted transcriptional regulator